MDRPCFISSLEDAAERRYEERYLGDDMMLCACGKKFNIHDGYPASPNPYSEAICPNCFFQMMEKLKTEKEKMNAKRSV